jgi:hypothetical protein
MRDIFPLFLPIKMCAPSGPTEEYNYSNFNKGHRQQTQASTTIVFFFVVLLLFFFLLLKNIKSQNITIVFSKLPLPWILQIKKDNLLFLIIIFYYWI